VPARTVAGSRLGQRPVVSMVLIGINVVAFVVTALQARSAMDLSTSELYLRGGLIPVEVASGEYWRLLTSAFLHGSLIHIATNMISLYILGIPLERILGRGRFLLIYLLSLLGSSVSVMVFGAPVSLTIGASGAIYGLMGALLVTFKRLRYDLRQLLIILALNVYITFQFPGISWQGHLGGLVVGAIVGAAMVYPPQPSRRNWQWGTAIGVVVVLIGVLVVRDTQLGTWSCVYEVGNIGCLPVQ
jgi:membrane associated rhomboid family serine protease